MKVLHVIETLDFGGAEKVVVDLVNATMGRCAPAVCCVKHSGELASRLAPQIELFSLGKGEGSDFKLSWQLARLMRQKRFDVVHSHLWGVFLESACAAKLARLPLIHTVHGNYSAARPGVAAGAKRALRRRFEYAVAPWHRRIVTVSDSIKSYVVNDMGIHPHHLETVHNGIDTRSPTKNKRHGNTFITVGRMAPVKNHAMMLRAFAKVVAERPQAKLQIVGDGPERAALEALAVSLSITDQVEFLGFRHEVSELLAKADVFLMSSHYEGISIAILEAMRAELPIIGTRVGGIPETVEHGLSGILVADNNEAEFTAAMLTLLDDPAKRIELGHTAAQRQRDEFSLESAAQRYLQLYAGEGLA